MENKNKRKEEEIDEQQLMSIMAGGVRKEGINMGMAERESGKNANNPKEIRNKRGAVIESADYETLFFGNAESNARSGKSVYIRPEFHERLTRIVQVIGEDKISLYSYLDNVLQHHFSEFAEQIKRSYDDKYKPIL